ncbi:ligand-binding sensor domain-containing protein [Flaviaesturariibacter aridisoli]|uniref:ligand-binding sensor domain-containing protein n=1 Tax=Flaviaesturariibacter aridisoli TaxID=2545761 RepID=UPI00140526AF|nr:triple tyrosine motif-containing protein [Flaviaesturariibacter aridisoli]
MRLFFLALSCLLVLLCGAQQTRQYTFQHFTTAQGLASNFVYSVVQDGDGFIWLATQNGLQRYDGNRFLTVQPQPQSAADGPIDRVLSVWSDRPGQIWLLAGNNRVALFDPRRFRYREARVLAARDSVAHYRSKYFFYGHDGSLYLHENFGPLHRFDAASFSFRKAEGFPLEAAGKRLLARITWDSTAGRYWVCGDDGLFAWDPRQKKIYGRGHHADADVPLFAGDTNCYFVEPTDRYIYYWYWRPEHGWPYVRRIDKKTHRNESYMLSQEMGIGYHEPTGILHQRSGRTWIHGNAFLAEWTERARPFLPVPNEGRFEQSIRYDQLYHSFEDAQRNVWLCTDNGLFLFNPDAQLFTSYGLFRPGGEPKEAPVLTVCQLPDSSFFIGTWSQGLFYYDKDFNPLPLPQSLSPYNKYSYWDMAINRRSGAVWMGLQPGRFVLYEPASGRSRLYNPPVLRNQTVRQVISDLVGNMWIGLNDGRVLKWDYEKAGGDPMTGYQEVLKAGQVSKIHRDRLGNVWVGCFLNGLYCVQAATGKLLRSWNASGPEGYRLFNNEVTDMSQLDDSTLLVTAGCINIINTKTGRVRFFSTADGLPSDHAMSIQKDYRGIFWIGLSNGLCRLNLDKRTVVFYDRRDGMLYDNFTRSGVELLSNGKLLFFTDHNILTFDPRRFTQSMAPPRPAITGITLQGANLPLDSLQAAGTLNLRYDRNALSFEFSGLSFTPQKKFHYYYMLEGLDKDWVHIENDNRAIYNYIPPGRYTFKVMSEDADGLTSEVALSVPVRVRPPVWQTWWFYALMILIAAFGLYLIDRERIRRLRALQQVRTQIAGNLHQEVETTLGDIHVLSEIAKIRAGTDLEQSKAFIDQISNKSRHMMEAMDDVLWSIDPANDGMQQMLMRIREFTDGITRNHTMDIDLIVDRKVEQLGLSMALRHELFFFYKESMQFLLQHVICDQVFINLKLKGPMLLLEIITSCEEDVPEFRSRYRQAVGPRVQAMKGLLEITMDHSNLSIVLRVVL